MNAICRILLTAIVCISSGETTASQQIETDLSLSAVIKTRTVIQPGEPVLIALTLSNNSVSNCIRVIRPNAISSDSEEQPHVYFTLQLLGQDGKWIDEPTFSRPRRCGLCDNQWQANFTDLEPGTALCFRSWLNLDYYTHEFQTAGTYRIIAHYDYGVRMHEKREYLPASIRDISTFQLTSAPIKITVQRPLDLILNVKSNMVVNTSKRLSDLFDISLVNKSSENVEVKSPTLHGSTSVRLDFDGQLPGWRPFINTQNAQINAKQVIKPGEILPLIGKGQFANGLDGVWAYPAADVVRIRAAYVQSWGADSFHVKSDWVKVTIKPQDNTK